MIWKAFITVCISAAIVLFPQNIIGCGPDADPYDYYTSFFHQNLPEANGYRPFYYTGLNFLYDESEPVEVSDLLAQEWAGYCGGPVTDADASLFVTKFERNDLTNLYSNIEKGSSLSMPDSIMGNSMTNYFIKTKDLEALGYLLYAKQLEPHVSGNSDAWEPTQRDSVKMAKLIKNGLQLYNAATSPFFKLRFAYQITRLAHYSGRYLNAIKFYDDYVSGNNTKSVLQPLSLALKGGALYRTGKTKEAAYVFSKAFSASTAKRVSNYLGFKWSTNAETPRNEYLAYCKTNEEKAAMLALFAMGSSDNELPAMKSIYQLNAGSEELEVLAVREINKLEETYLTPILKKEKGGSTFYYYWDNQQLDSVTTAAKKETKELTAFLLEAGNNKQVKNRGLFETGAAYAAYMMKDYTNSKKYLAAAEKMNLTKKVKDQWTLTNILVTINEKDKIDAAFEEQLLPSLFWLEERVRNEKPATTGYYQTSQWKKIYRDLMSEILAKRYHQAGDYHKEALCIGAADVIESPEANRYSNKGVDYMRNNLSSKDVENLYALFTAKQRNKFENYLIKKNAINTAVVTEFAGTAYLREYDYARAIEWFKKSPDKKSLPIKKNPFIDLLYDQEEPLAKELKFSTSKLAFAESMLLLTKQAETDKTNAAKYYYKLANGLYNMTYYGHTWELVQYYRGSTDGYRIPTDANAFKKEYYGCHSAEAYFEKAMNASQDKNFKARCLFMMAKCSQKQVSKPVYSDFNYNWNQLDAAEKLYWPKFKKNRHFPQLVKEYSNTAFYSEAYNSCSYLRDFVSKRK